MMKLQLTALPLVALCGPMAAAQPSPPPATAVVPVARTFGPGSQLFIAPSGQPFRAAAGAPYPVADWFAQADANHDGKLTQGEFVSDFARYFDSLDADHDGILSAKEIARYETVLVPEVQGYDGGGFGGHSQPLPDPDTDTADSDGNVRVHDVGDYERDRERERPSGGARFEIVAAPEPVVSMDLDFDGRVSRSEMSQAAQRRYQLLVEEQSADPITFAGLPETWVQSHPPKHHDKGGSRRGHWRR